MSSTTTTAAAAVAEIPKMEYVRFGASGMRVSNLILKNLAFLFTNINFRSPKSV
jgi:hypothetical protein